MRNIRVFNVSVFVLWQYITPKMESYRPILFANRIVTNIDLFHSKLQRDHVLVSQL